jgi:uncharacterized membrane protein (Fun14 family)
MSIRRACAVTAVVLAVAFQPVVAQDIGTFDPFVADDHSVADTVATIDDPTGQAPSAKVYSFRIPAGSCSDELYEPGSEESDCFFNSARSQIRENVFATKRNANVQPKESWYGWAVYFPEDFAYGTKQTKGSFEFAYWHNHQCPHLTFVHWPSRDGTLYLGTNKALGNYECTPGPTLKVADFSDLVGKWSRFEMFVKWANDETGEAKVYLNGQYVIHYKGPTLTAGYENVNYFKFGLYLCCTPNVATIKEASVLYASVKRADKREDLFIAEDRATIRLLQDALNALGCDVGAADGVIGRRTREMALSCKAFPDGTLPSALTAGSLQRFVELYTGESVADLPPGKLDEARAEVAVATYGAVSSVTPGIHVAEVRAEKSGNEVEAISHFAGTINGAEEARDEISFLLIGQFNYAASNFDELDILLTDDLGPTAPPALLSCPGQRTETWGDGSMRAVIRLRKAGQNFTASGGRCIIAALPGKAAFQAEFLLTRFREMAVSMVTDGTIDQITHDGVKIFMNRVALGEISIESIGPMTPGEVAAPVELPAPKFILKTQEDWVWETGKAVDVRSLLRSTIEGGKAGEDALYFKVQGHYNYLAEDFLNLALVIQEPVGETKPEGLASCPGVRTEFYEGVHHVMIKLKKQGDDWVAQGADCIIANIPAKPAFMARFVLANFRDVAIGLVSSGRVNALENDGLRTFMQKVAEGKIVVR